MGNPYNVFFPEPRFTRFHSGVKSARERVLLEEFEFQTKFSSRVFFPERRLTRFHSGVKFARELVCLKSSSFIRSFLFFPLFCAGELYSPFCLIKIRVKTESLEIESLL